MQNATLEIKWDEQSQNMLFIITTKEYSDQAIIDDSFECDFENNVFTVNQCGEFPIFSGEFR